MSREEPHVVAALVDLCKSLDVKCVIQVGSEDGWEAEKVREATGCRAIAIDADPKCQPCSKDLEYYRFVVGATNSDSVPFYVHSSEGLSSLIPREDSKEEKIHKPQVRLDFLCSLMLLKPDALIIDTEGTTMEVLEGCGTLLDSVKLIYAECQVDVIRPGIRTLPEVDSFLAVRGFKRHHELPSYDGGAQGNYTWIRTILH